MASSQGQQPLNCLKIVKIWFWSSAKDHIGRKKVRGSRWWCLFCPSWPRNLFMSKIWWHPKIPIVNSGAKLLKNLKNRFLSFFPTDFFYLWTKTLAKYQNKWEIWSQALAMRYIHAFVKAGRDLFNLKTQFGVERDQKL